MHQKSIVFYHGDCPSGDGFASAFAAWLKLGDTAEYVPVSYGDGKPLPDVTGKNVFILDFSFEAEVLEQLSARARSLVLLDHHKAAKDKLFGKRFTCACHQEAILHIDLSQAGCVLAWRHFHPELPLPQLFRHIQDRDLWAWELPDSPAFLARMDLVPRTFEDWKKLLSLRGEQFEKFVQDGVLLLQQRTALNTAVASTSFQVFLAGNPGLMANAPHELANEVGSLLAAKSGTYGLVWSQLDLNTVKCSLRSIRGTGVDVDHLARLFGGAGHPSAAGFKLSVAQLPALLAGQLNPVHPTQDIQL